MSSEHFWMYRPGENIGEGRTIDNAATTNHRALIHDTWDIMTMDTQAVRSSTRRRHVIDREQRIVAAIINILCLELRDGLLPPR